MDGCSGGFSETERSKFLDKKLMGALDRIAAGDMLRTANMKDLENCPFCDYAEVYPPVEENKEFQCLSPACSTVSCRLCHKKTHIPKTCDEAAKNYGLSARRLVEEAMSDAMIRRCNKCKFTLVHNAKSAITDRYNRQHTIYQKKWLQQNEMPEMQKHAVLHLLRNSGIFTLSRRPQGQKSEI